MFAPWKFLSARAAGWVYGRPARNPNTHFQVSAHRVLNVRVTRQHRLEAEECKPLTEDGPVCRGSTKWRVPLWEERSEQTGTRRCHFASVGSAKRHLRSAAGARRKASEERRAESQRAPKFRRDGESSSKKKKKKRIRRSANKRGRVPSDFGALAVTFPSGRSA